MKLADFDGKWYDRMRICGTEGRSNIWIYGIAFYKKRCKVAAEKML